MLGGEAITDGLRRSAREMLRERSAAGAFPAKAAAAESTPTGESERAKGESALGTRDTKASKDTKGSSRVRGA
jgi:hypothetical protein